MRRNRILLCPLQLKIPPRLLLLRLQKKLLLRNKKKEGVYLYCTPN